MTSQKPALVLMTARRDPAAAGLDDDRLMEKVQAGDRSAFDAIVTRHQERLLRVAHRFLGDAAAAQDAVQNTFVELYCAAPRYRACGKLKSYIYRLLLNQCRRAWRSRRSESRLLALVPAAPSSHDLRSRSFKLDIELGLSRLRAPERSIVSLHYAGGLTYQEIADTLDAPVGTVKRRVSEAVAKLRDTLDVP